MGGQTHGNTRTIRNSSEKDGRTNQERRRLLRERTINELPGKPATGAIQNHGRLESKKARRELLCDSEEHPLQTELKK